MYVWPWRLLPPKSWRTRLSNETLTGDTSISGAIQAARTDGGGLWLSDHLNIAILTPDQIQCLEAWTAEMDGGATPFILPCWKLLTAPRPFMGGDLALPGAPSDSPDFFAQDPSFGAPVVTAAMVGAAALRATQVKIAVQVGTPLRGGEHFSIPHASGAWRMYKVGRIVSADSGGQTVNIRPPLREAIAGGEAAEFDVPRFQAQLMPSKADELSPDLQLGRFATVNGYFMEAF